MNEEVTWYFVLLLHEDGTTCSAAVSRVFATDRLCVSSRVICFRTRITTGNPYTCCSRDVNNIGSLLFFNHVAIAKHEVQTYTAVTQTHTHVYDPKIVNYRKDSVAAATSSKKLKKHQRSIHTRARAHTHKSRRG